MISTRVCGDTHRAGCLEEGTILSSLRIFNEKFSQACYLDEETILESLPSEIGIPKPNFWYWTAALLAARVVPVHTPRATKSNGEWDESDQPQDYNGPFVYHLPQIHYLGPRRAPHWTTPIKFTSAISLWTTFHTSTHPPPTILHQLYAAALNRPNNNNHIKTVVILRAIATRMQKTNPKTPTSGDLRAKFRNERPWKIDSKC